MCRSASLVQACIRRPPTPFRWHNTCTHENQYDNFTKTLCTIFNYPERQLKSQKHV